MLTTALLLLAAVGAVILRFGWDAREPAQVRLTLAGWAAIGASLIVLTLRDGAWGLAMGTLPVMLAAFALLAREGIVSAAPARAARVADSDPSVHLHSRDWRDLGRRFAIFFLAVPVAGAVSVLVGLAFASVARAGGADPADSTVIALLVTPLIWSVLGVVMLLEAQARAMLRPLAALGAVSGAAVWLIG